MDIKIYFKIKILFYQPKVTDNGQYLVFEQQQQKKRNSNSTPSNASMTTTTTSNIPARSESFPRGENVYSSKYQSTKNNRRSGHFDGNVEYSTPVTRESLVMANNADKKEVLLLYLFRIIF